MPEDQQQGSDGKSDQQQQQQQQPIDFEAWLKEQPEHVRAGYETHTKGLKSALDTERETRKAQEKQLRELAGKAEKGSETQKALEEQANKLSALEQQSDFYDAAHKLGVTDLKLAYLAAQSASLIDTKGRANFDELKRLHPQLFGAPASGPGKVDGGAGKQPAAGGMNEYIRKSAGRG